MAARSTRASKKKKKDEEDKEEEGGGEGGGVVGKKRTRSTRGKGNGEEGREEVEEEEGVGKKGTSVKRRTTTTRGGGAAAARRKEEKGEEEDGAAVKKKTTAANKKETRAVKTTRKTTRGKAKKQEEEEKEEEEEGAQQVAKASADAPREETKEAEESDQKTAVKEVVVNAEQQHISEKEPEKEPEVGEDEPEPEPEEEEEEELVGKMNDDAEQPQEAEAEAVLDDTKQDAQMESHAIVEVPSRQGELVVYDGAAPSKAPDGVGEIVVLQDGSHVRRTSSLLAPTLRLTGHSAGVLDVRFSPDGDVLATASVDSKLFLWSVHGECENYMALHGHKNAVTCLDWAHDGEQVATGSADATVRCWDVVMGKQMKKYAEHTSIVNSCCTTRKGASPMVLSGADDGTAKLWDPRMKESAKTYMEQYQLTSVCFSDDASAVFTGGIDGVVRRYDLRMDVQPSLTLEGHTDIVTGLRVSPDGDFMLSNAMDNTLRIWDLRPYAPADRNIKVLIGHTHGHEKQLLRCDWSKDGRSVASGSADACVYVWDTTSRRISYRLPGHKGCVNAVAFHPLEDVIASGANDSVVFLGELGE